MFLNTVLYYHSEEAMSTLLTKRSSFQLSDDRTGFCAGHLMEELPFIDWPHRSPN
jgi:hypothetical protein